MPKNDYRVTRSGRNGPGEVRNQEGVVNVPCPNCVTKTPHILVKTSIKNRLSLMAICEVCGLKRFWRWTEPSPQSDRDNDDKSRRVQALKASMWGWLANRFDDILAVSVPDRVYNYSGRLGNSRRNKGSNAFASVRFAPEFLKWMETPEVIRDYADALKRLAVEDEELYAFIYYRAMGMTYAMMDGYFAKSLVRAKVDKSPGRGGRILSGYGEKLQTRASIWVFDQAPKQIKDSFGKGDLLSDTQRSMTKCPVCDGKGDHTCGLCHGNREVNMKTARTYARKVADGSWKENN